MESAGQVDPLQLEQLLLNVAPVRPIFIWGQPGIGKSALVEQFADNVGMPCISLLGSQLAPEDIIGVPQIVNGKSRFCPPTNIARDEAFILFLDELNACSHEVQKAFYSLINDKRIGEFALPPGTVVIGAGNRAEDAAIVKPLSSALINRMLHVSLKPTVSAWLTWAGQNDIHPWVYQYIELRSDHLWSKPPRQQETFSTPRSWHALSDALKSINEEDLDNETIAVLAKGLLTPAHAQQFCAFVKQKLNEYGVHDILKGNADWPSKPEDRDVLYFLVHSFRALLIKELPENLKKISGDAQELSQQAKKRLVELSRISVELAQLVLAEDEDGRGVPDWFLAEVIRDLPRLAAK